MILQGVYHHLKRSDAQFFYFLKWILLTLDFFDQVFHRILSVTKSYFPIGSFWLASTGYLLGPWSPVATLPVNRGALAYFRGMDDNYPEDDSTNGINVATNTGDGETLEKMRFFFGSIPKLLD